MPTVSELNRVSEHLHHRKYWNSYGFFKIIPLSEYSVQLESAETASCSQSETLRQRYSPTAASEGTAQETRQKLILLHLSVKD